MNYTPTKDSTDFALTVRRLDEDDCHTVSSKPVQVRVHHKLKDKLTKNICICGDSLVDNGSVATEVYRLLAEDNDCVIHQLGTRGPSGGKHEGRGSWTFARYLADTDYAGKTNAFWDKIKGRLDFQKYCETNGYEGIDYFLIALGTNDVSQGTTLYRTEAEVQKFVDQAKQFIDALLDKETGFPNCKIGIGLCGPGSDYSYQCGSSMGIFHMSIQKKFQSGVPHINLKRMLGYELGANKQWVIVPEQAEIIRYIFDRFVKGQTANKIAQELNQMEKFTVNGKKWSASSILIVLRNEKYVGDIEMQKTITKDFLTHRSSINKGEAPRYYVKNHHVGIIDRVTWDKVQTMLFEKPRADMTKGPGKKKVKSIKGSPFGNLRCGAILEHGPDAGKPCGEGFFRTTYTGVANGYSDERSLKATGEDTGEYLEKYTYSYPVWRCKRKVGERDGEPPKNGSPDQKAYCRSKKGCMSDEEKEAANKRCPSERYHECALEQSFMELLYSMKRDFEQHGDASMIVTMFDNAYEQAVRLANNNSISVQRMATVENQIKEMEERLQDAISHQVAALREAALEQNVELNEALSNGEVTIDDIDLDIRSGLTPGSIGVSFYGTETEEGSEAQIYTELVNDLQERLKALQQERQTIEEEQGVLAIMKKNFEYFLACLKELPDTNAGGMPLRVNGLDVQGTLLRDMDGNAIEGRKRAITSGKFKLTPERIAEAPDMLHFEKGIYCAFVESGVLQGDVATYKTNFGVTLTSKGNRRTLDSFMGYKRSDMEGNVVYVDAPYKVYGFSIQYRRYLTTAAKREREEAV